MCPEDRQTAGRLRFMMIDVFLPAKRGFVPRSFLYMSFDHYLVIIAA